MSSAPMQTLQALVAARITHVIGIPDNTSGPLFDALAHHPSIRLVRVAREGEAFAVASGLWLGGASPLVVIQNTGLLESGDALRGTALRMGAPVPMLVTGRGYAKMEAAGLTPDVERSRALLTRPDVDSTALMTEPTLQAWGVPFERCSAGDDPAAALTRCIDRARNDRMPVATIVARSLT